jgi:hypothetical protein
MDDGKATFAAYPLAVTGADARIVQDSRLIQENAAAVN